MKRGKIRTAGFIMLTVFIYGFTVNYSLAQEHELTARDLVSESEIVVVGQVSSIRSEWSEDRSYIFTQVTIAVEEYLKGDRSDQSITLRQLGGEIDDIGEIYSHTARFQAEEEVLVFLRRDQRGTLQIAGGEQGKFKITRNIQTGQRMVEGNVPLDTVTRDLRVITGE
jgi:hypothetical protein